MLQEIPDTCDKTIPYIQENSESNCKTSNNSCLLSFNSSSDDSKIFKTPPVPPPSSNLSISKIRKKIIDGGNIGAVASCRNTEGDSLPGPSTSSHHASFEEATVTSTASYKQSMSQVALEYMIFLTKIDTR